VITKTRHTIERLLVCYLPKQLHGLFGFLYGYLVPPKKSYSASCEDLIILNFFDKIGVKTGFYIDIGAYHPRFCSNSYLLHKRGWRGVCVDIDDKKLKQFRLFRGKRVETLCGAVVPERGQTGQITTIYKHKRLLSEIDTLDELEAMNNKNRKGWDYEACTQRKISPDYFEDTYAHIDLIDIDIEGLDIDLLLNLDLKKVAPTVILFEDKRNFGGRPKIRNHLEKNGYRFLFASGETIGYYLKSALTSENDSCESQ